jgi:hypothetical protein
LRFVAYVGLVYAVVHLFDVIDFVNGNRVAMKWSDSLYHVIVGLPETLHANGSSLRVWMLLQAPVGTVTAVLLLIGCVAELSGQRSGVRWLQLFAITSLVNRFVGLTLVTAYHFQYRSEIDLKFAWDIYTYCGETVGASVLPVIVLWLTFRRRTASRTVADQF